MTALTQAKDNFLAELGGLAITTDGIEHPVQFPSLDGWQELDAMPGLFIRPVPVPGCDHSDYFNSRGAAGVHAEQASIPQSSQFTVITGAVLWKQQFANEGRHFRLGPGDTARLAPYEEHSYLFLEDCLCTIVITPPLAQLYPPQV